MVERKSMGVGGGEKVAKWACQNEMGSLLWLRRPLWNRRARSEALPRSGRRMKEKWTHMYSEVGWSVFCRALAFAASSSSFIVHAHTLFFPASKTRTCKTDSQGRPTLAEPKGTLILLPNRKEIYDSTRVFKQDRNVYTRQGKYEF